MGVWSLMPAIPASLIPVAGAGEAKVTVEAVTWPFPFGPMTYPLLLWETVWPASAKKDVKRNTANRNL
jgi:hypothetical protein